MEALMSENKHLLIVDDEEYVRLLYREELENEGYSVATSDGQENILEVLKRENPDVVILDIKLGINRSGLDLLQEIRSKDRNIPVILCTAYDAYQHDYKTVAADYYVIKSVDMSELKEKISLAIAKSEKS